MSLLKNFLSPSRLTKRMGARKLLSTLQTNRQSVRCVQYVPPVLGRKNDFGSFHVEFEYGTTTLL
jgi:hypothetical protein